MLYDPRWETIYTTKRFAAWLATKPATEKYDYCDPENCAIGQYLKAVGAEKTWMRCDEINRLGWSGIVLSSVPQMTFGHAARRARIEAGTASIKDRVVEWLS
jgi:hypothetical protein